MSGKLETSFCGINFKNPVIVPAGAHGRDGDVIYSVSKSGVAGICTKTIVAQPASDVLPCFTQVKGGMLNSVFGSDKTTEYWFSEGLKRASEGDSIVLANLAGFYPEQAAELAAKAEASGADVIMMPTHCPHMGEILTAMFPGMEMPEPKLTDLEPMKQSVKLIKEAVKVPVVVKLSGTFAHIVKEWAHGVKESGADGIACSDALGPGLSIDIKTGQPALGGPRGVGGLTGPAIKPISLRMVLEAAMTIDLPVIGVGGVSSAEDVIEYIMAGASLVGICTAGHLNGTHRYTKIIQDLEKFLTTAEIPDIDNVSLEAIRGLTIKRIRERKEKNLQAVVKPVTPSVDKQKCIACGKCKSVCVYEAVEVEETAIMDGDRCVGCGLCVSVCPTGALSQSYY
jgi:dihydroorotate dehydrogenase (NAD+) catalytic subunit